MAIFRCNKCALLQEQADSLIGQNYACPNCGNLAPVYNAMFFIEKLLDKYFQAQREVIRLKSPAQKEGATPKLSTSPAAPADFDVFNTDHLAGDCFQRIDSDRVLGRACITSGGRKLVD